MFRTEVYAHDIQQTSTSPSVLLEVKTESLVLTLQEVKLSQHREISKTPCSSKVAQNRWSVGLIVPLSIGMGGPPQIIALLSSRELIAQ